MGASYRPDTAPAPTRLAVAGGLAYALFLPAGPPRGGLVILHGAGSCKESHFDFARLAASEGLAALAFDARGHGDSEGALDGGALRDVAAMAERVREACAGGPVALRGSSMGGWMALAAARAVRADAVIALCPASSEGLRRALRRQELAFRCERDALDALLSEHDPREAAAALGERLMLVHAEGDEQVAVSVSDGLHAAAPGSRYVRVPGGHHRSVQHDGELQAASLRWLRRRLEPLSPR